MANSPRKPACVQTAAGSHQTQGPHFDLSITAAAHTGRGISSVQKASLERIGTAGAEECLQARWQAGIGRNPGAARGMHAS